MEQLDYQSKLLIKYNDLTKNILTPYSSSPSTQNFPFVILAISLVIVRYADIVLCNIYVIAIPIASV